MAQCSDQLHVKLTAMGMVKPIERMFSHGHHNTEKDKPGSKKQTVKLASNRILNALIYYCLCAPRFINYPSSYAPLSQEFPAIILSQQYRPNKPFDSRSELFLLFLKNPSNI